MEFQDKVYDIIDHNKCPFCEKSAEKSILRQPYFHHSEPKYRHRYDSNSSIWQKLVGFGIVMLSNRYFSLLKEVVIVLGCWFWLFHHYWCLHCFMRKNINELSFCTCAILYQCP